MKYINQLIFGISLSLGLNPSYAEEFPSLWDGPATAPAALHVPEASEKASENKSTLEYVPLSPIFFNIDSANLSKEGELSLDAAAQYILKHDNIKRILIEGHTDGTGPEPYNDQLSEQRIVMVRNYLALRGVDPSLVVSQGKGERFPVDQNWTREGRKRNRQVAIYAVQWNQ